MSENLSEHVAENRRYWDAMADEWVSFGERAWESEARWGEWEIPNTELPLLADEMHGQRAIELGCGTGYVSAWMRRRGASVYAIDNSEAQLATARRLSDLHGLDDIEWVHGNAETVAQPDGSFDFAISEYGAAIWCEPMAWIGEAHRLLRPGGELVFLGNHPLAMVCSPIDGSAPVTERLERAYFDLGRLDWRDAIDEPGGIEFNLPISSWIRLFHDIGFDVIDYIEVRAPESATGIHGTVAAEWAKRFPSEQVWRVRKRRRTLGLRNGTVAASDPSNGNAAPTITAADQLRPEGRPIRPRPSPRQATPYLASLPCPSGETPGAESTSTTRSHGKASRSAVPTARISV